MFGQERFEAVQFTAVEKSKAGYFPVKLNGEDYLAIFPKKSKEVLRVTFEPGISAVTNTHFCKIRDGF